MRVSVAEPTRYEMCNKQLIFKELTSFFLLTYKLKIIFLLSNKKSGLHQNNEEIGDIQGKGAAWGMTGQHPAGRKSPNRPRLNREYTRQRSNISNQPTPSSLQRCWNRSGSWHNSETKGKRKHNIKSAIQHANQAQNDPFVFIDALGFESRGSLLPG